MSITDAMTDAQFAAVEEAMLQTDLGRSFLDEFARRRSVVRAAEVMGVLGEVKQSLEAQSASTHIEILRRELQEMSASIMQTRREIASIKPEDTGNNRIMAATGELDVIVSATERATTDILASAELLQDIVMKLREEGVSEASCDELETHVINIFTACSFQDITGQRITKVVNAMRYLEQRVNAMIEIWGVDGIEPSDTGSELLDERPDAHLLEGPQGEDEAASQDDIDRILHEALAEA
jgi:chemotaxis regulatin CheY-phosphate phosphatase CheZ